MLRSQIRNRKTAEPLSSDKELKTPAPIEVRQADIDVNGEFIQVSRKHSVKTPPPILIQPTITKNAYGVLNSVEDSQPTNSIAYNLKSSVCPPPKIPPIIVKDSYFNRRSKKQF